MRKPLVITPVLAATLFFLTGCSSESVLETADGTEPTSEMATEPDPPADFDSIEPETPPYIGDDAMFDFIVSIRDEFLERVSSPEDKGRTPELLGRPNTVYTITPPRCEIVYFDGKSETSQFVALDFGLQSVHGYGYIGGGSVDSAAQADFISAKENCVEFTTSTPSATQYSLDGGEFDTEQYRLEKFSELSDGLFTATYRTTMDQQIIDPQESCHKTGCRTLLERGQRSYHIFSGESYVYFEITNYTEVTESDVYENRVVIDETDENTDEIALWLSMEFDEFLADRADN